MIKSPDIEYNGIEVVAIGGKVVVLNAIRPAAVDVCREWLKTLADKNGDGMMMITMMMGLTMMTIMTGMLLMKDPKQNTKQNQKPNHTAAPEIEQRVHTRKGK